MPNVNLTRFNVFSLDLGRGKHNFKSDTTMVYKLAFINAVPAVTASLWSDISANEIAAGGGYAAGGFALTVSDAALSVTQTVNGSSVTTQASALKAANVNFTATGAVGAFQSVVIYNSTNGALVGFYPVTQQAMSTNDSFNTAFDQTNGFEQIGAPSGT